MTPPDPLLHHLVDLTQACLHLVQEVREGNPETGPLATPLLRISRFLSAVARQRAGLPRSPVNPYAPPASAPAPELLRALGEALERLLSLCRGAASKAPNYFGLFAERLSNLELCDVTSHAHAVYLALAGLRAAPAAASSGRIVSLSARLFWEARWPGAAAAAVRWADFAAEFEARYGQQPPRTLGRLRHALTKPPRGVGGDDDDDDDASFAVLDGAGLADHWGAADGRVVRVDAFDALTRAHGGAWEAFQAVANCGTAVFAMGSVEDDVTPRLGEPRQVDGLAGLDVTQICCGGQHAAVLTGAGEVFTWGRGGFGRLGHGNAQSLKHAARVEGFGVGAAEAAAAAAAAAAAVPARDRVAAARAAAAAVRAPPPAAAAPPAPPERGDYPASVVPAALPQRQRCVQVACGFAYTAAVTAGGELYTWGAGENGRLGLGDVSDRNAPTHVAALRRAGVSVSRVYAGSVHTCLLTTDGVLYACGKHEYTGHGLAADVLAPVPLSAFGASARVEQISVGPGGYHTIALVSDRADALSGDGSSDDEAVRFDRVSKVYTWGHNRVGQLGYGNDEAAPRNVEGAYFVPRPTEVVDLRRLPIASVVAGWGHSAVVGEDGSVRVCGRNYMGQLGLGDPKTFPRNERDHPFLPAFTAIESLKGQVVVQVACGGEHSVALTRAGEECGGPGGAAIPLVYTFGAGAKGQLGHGGTDGVVEPRAVAALAAQRRETSMVACGNNCTLVLAGRFRPAPLFGACADAVRRDPALWRQAGAVLAPMVVDLAGLAGPVVAGAGGEARADGARGIDAACLGVHRRGDGPAALSPEALDPGAGLGRSLGRLGGLCGGGSPGREATEPGGEVLSVQLTVTELGQWSQARAGGRALQG